MEGNIELLDYIYQNSQMGIETIKQLLEITTDESFKKYLESEVNEYTEINKSAEELINKRHAEEKGISNVAKIRTYLAINMKTLTDKSTSHIAEMLIQGSTMGIIEAIKNLKKYQNAEKEIIALGKKLLKFEENNMEELKEFL